MKIIKANSILIDRDSMTEYQIVEKIGRSCYKSEDKITDNSSKDFVSRMFKSNHHAMLEHGYVYSRMSTPTFNLLMEAIDYYRKNSKITFKNYLNYSHLNGSVYVTGSFRAWIDIIGVAELDGNVVEYIDSKLNKIYPEIFKCDKTIYGYDMDLMTRKEFIDDVKSKTTKKIDVETVLFNCLPQTIQFITDRGVTHEFVRHRPSSFAQESTRYCNYGNDKFGNEITFIEPLFFEKDSIKYKIWEKSCKFSEECYFELLEEGAKPQEARDVLNHSVKTELTITATEEEWQHIIDLRYHGTTGAPHPQMLEVMEITYPLLVSSSEGRLS